MDFVNLDWNDGDTSIPGIFNIAVAIPKKDILTWPTFAAVPATVTEDVTYIGSFTLVALKTWKKINAIDSKCNVVCEPQGEIRSSTFNNKATIKTSLTNEAATSFAKRSNNADMVYLVQEKDSAKWRVIGNKMFNTITKPMLAIGGEPTSDRGTTLEVEVTDSCPAPFYIGAIMTDDGDINPVV